MARIPLARPYWDAECEQAAIDALNSGRWVKGPQGKLFGEEFAEDMENASFQLKSHNDG